MTNLVKNGLLLVTITVLLLLLSEVIVRQFFHPVDFLLPQTVTDPVLGHRVLPNTGGHDDWGYRNYSVGSEAEIVAIGDSQTYGVSATFQESWPAHLSRLKDTSVYNLSLGGYGPLQYLHLLSTRAIALKPETVVVGLFLGNDLVDSYSLAYSNENWAEFRDPLLQDVKSEQTKVATNWKEKRFLNGLRIWLAKHSVLYRIVTQSVIGNLVRAKEIKDTVPGLIGLQHGEARHQFLPDYRFSALDTRLQSVNEGIRVSKQAIKEIKLLCQAHQIRLLVVLIPTKELVYFDLFEEQYGSEMPDSLTMLFENENRIRAEFIQLFEQERINFVDSLPALKMAVSRGEHIYPLNDGHTNGNGYLIIAKEINKLL